MGRPPLTPRPRDPLAERAYQLGLWGLLANWEDTSGSVDLETLIAWEEAERQQRSLQRRIRNARLGRFKPMADFDWNWPEEIDRGLVQDLFSLEFVGEPANVVLVGPNSVGKTMILKNLAHQAVLSGHTALVVTASEMLHDLAEQETPSAFRRRLVRYTRPAVLAIDEVGYLSYGDHHADLFFEVVSRRYDSKAIVLTTNKAFREWNEIFPNASCVVSLIDRLVHRAEIVSIKGESYRLKESKERTTRKAKARSSRRKASRS